MTNILPVPVINVTLNFDENECAQIESSTNQTISELLELDPKKLHAITKRAHDEFERLLIMSEVVEFEDDELKPSYDFYIASGFFTPEQLDEVEFIKAELTKRNLTYFSPKDDSAVADINNPEARKKVFGLNDEAIRRSKALIVNTNNKDMGTLFEAGLAYGLGKDIIYVCFQLGKGGQLNLMLSESGKAACTTREELCEALDGKENYWDGEIE